MNPSQVYAEVVLLLRRATASQWKEANPVLALGEPGIVTDAADAIHMLKIGDGKTEWSRLPFVPGDSYIPQRGVDYYTADDREAIIKDVLSNFVDVSEVGG